MAIRKTWLACLVLVYVIRDTCSQTFDEVPVDTAVLLGDTAQFNCSILCTGLDICTGLTWSERVSSPTGNTDLDIYYQSGNTFNPNHPNKDRYSIVPGTTNLRISNIKESDAGRYICQPNRGARDATIKFAFLTALDKLTCNNSGIVVEGSTAFVTCNIKFYKSSDALDTKTPSLQWDIPGTIQTKAPEDAEITAKFTVTSDDNGRNFTCRAYYEKPPPLYSDACITSLIVHFGPKDMLIITKSTVDWTSVKPGDALTCTASANPEPSFVWWKVSGSGNDNAVLNGAVLTVTAAMKGRYRFACKATNIVNHEIKTAGIYINFIVVVQETETSSTTTIKRTQVAQDSSTESSFQSTEQQTTIKDGANHNVAPADSATTNLVPAVVVLYVISLPSLVLIIVLLVMFIQIRKRLIEITSDKAYMTLKPIQQTSPGESEYSQIQSDKSSDPSAVDSPLPYSTVYENSEVLHKRQRDNKV